MKSSFSGADSCVDVTISETWVWVAHSTASANDPVPRFTRAEWAAFVAGVKAGEFDVEPVTS